MTTHSVATTHPAVNSVLHVVCAWCQKDMGTKPGNGSTGVTHGMCPECREIELAKATTLIAEKGDEDAR